jgi:hypothetical protein
VLILPSGGIPPQRAAVGRDGRQHLSCQGHDTKRKNAKRGMSGKSLAVPPGQIYRGSGWPTWR